MTTNVQNTAGSIVITVRGDIDHTGAESLKNTFSQINLAGISAVAFNFANVDYIGSSGLGKLLLFYKRLSASGIKMRVESASPRVRELLKELKMDTLFTVS